jgi:REP element-mobilizing transposase RayT
MRLVRQSTIGVLTHVICRFVDRRWMLSDEHERTTYLELLGSALSHSDWRCVAFALMSSHLHFAMIPGHDDLQSWTKRVNSPFARWLNARHDRLGPVFADRPAEWSMHANKAALIAYIHNNPVRAGIVERAELSSWTSHRAYVGGVTVPRWLRIDEGLAICGFTRPDAAAFNAWVDESIHGTPALPDLAAIRAAVRDRGVVEIGTPVLGEDGCEVPILSSRHTLLRIPPDIMLDRVVHVLQVDRGAICSRSHRPACVAARRVFLHASQRVGNNAAQSARHVGISSQAASRHLSVELSSGEQRLVERIVQDVQVGTMITAA